MTNDEGMTNDGARMVSNSYPEVAVSVAHWALRELQLNQTAYAMPIGLLNAPITRQNDFGSNFSDVQRLFVGQRFGKKVRRLSRRSSSRVLRFTPLPFCLRQIISNVRLPSSNASNSAIIASQASIISSRTGMPS